MKKHVAFLESESFFGIRRTTPMYQQNKAMQLMLLFSTLVSIKGEANTNYTIFFLLDLKDSSREKYNTHH
jgi:hypothetical protein